MFLAFVATLNSRGSNWTPTILIVPRSSCRSHQSEEGLQSVVRSDYVQNRMNETLS